MNFLHIARRPRRHRFAARGEQCDRVPFGQQSTVAWIRRCDTNPDEHPVPAA